ncbi:NAD-dependent epimerase/dehydratase family protein [candidate division WOR-3 bacterium]|nr:NAD-dependent epimerase/dehydratase family protein [candidate division WOR-3 bacterium]
MEKILICGAGGFIGSHMAKRLSEEGNFVRVVDIKWDGFMDEPYYSEKLTLDLREKENCMKATKGVDIVFQFAADMGGIGYITQIGADIMKNSSLININMIQASLENKIKKIFFSSSACIYPEYKQLESNVTALREDDAIPAQPDQFYGWEKLYAEKLYEGYGKDYGLNYRIARFHNIFGPYGTYDGGKEKAPAALCRKVALASNPGEIDIWGDGEQTRSFCYIDDCLEGCIKLMNSDYKEPLNIGSDEMVTINEMADMIIEISGKKITKKFDSSKPQGVRGRNSDNTLIKKVLGWAPSTTLKEGIEKTYPWIAEQVNKK